MTYPSANFMVTADNDLAVILFHQARASPFPHPLSSGVPSWILFRRPSTKSLMAATPLFVISGGCGCKPVGLGYAERGEYIQGIGNILCGAILNTSLRAPRTPAELKLPPCLETGGKFRGVCSPVRTP